MQVSDDRLKRLSIRHQAFQIAAQLPEEPLLAIAIIDLARQLVEDGLKPDAEIVTTGSAALKIVR